MTGHCASRDFPFCSTIRMGRRLGPKKITRYIFMPYMYNDRYIYMAVESLNWKDLACDFAVKV